MSAPKPPAAEPGATPSKAKKVRGVVYVNAVRCKGCGFCVAFCPPHVLAFTEEFNAQGYHFPRLVQPEGCTGCDLCGLYCPDFAIYGVMIRNGSPRSLEATPTGEEE